ncbi:flagellar protein FlaG [Nitrospinae bacterium]|nr:flagellar protein FlaG [Nitrospinota bacterium]
MDTPAVNSAGIPPVRLPKTQSSASKSGPKVVQTSETKVSNDKVDLSSKAKVLVENKNGVQISTNNEQKKFSVTDDNDVVIQVIDPKTQKVVKSIPTEEQIQLKNAVRDGINDILD